MYVCPTFSSIPCQTFISAFLPPPSIIFSHITHVIQSKMTCSHWGEERRRGDKRWVLFSVLGEIPSFSRTDEEETNSTIHSLPFTKKKNIFRTSSFRLLVGQTAVAAATRLHIIYLYTPTNVMVIYNATEGSRLKGIAGLLLGTNTDIQK